MMAIEVDLQVATDPAGLPGRERIEAWVAPAVADLGDAEVTVRLVGREESAALNERYRGRSGPTNVLSFPADLPPGIELPFLGDVVICVPLVDAEAAAQGKERVAHFAHLVVHGVLHLRGYDHADAAEAVRMEAIETRLLAELGFPDPYA